MQTIILNWAFGQLFGTKAKNYFITNIEPTIDAAVASNPHDVGQLIASFTTPTMLGQMTDKLLAGVKIPAMYKGIASAMLAQWVSDSINRAFHIKTMSLNSLASA